MADSPFIFEATAQNFRTAVIEASYRAPVLVDFWAEWCQPCKALMPLLAQLAESYKGKFLLAKVNTEQEQELAAHFGIRSIPTVKLIKDGKLIDEFSGALPEAQVRAFLDRHIMSETDKLVAQGTHYLMRGDADSARRLLEKAQALEPNNPRVLIALAQFQATMGAIEEAESILNSLPDEEQRKPEVTGMRARFFFDRLLTGAPKARELEKRLEKHPADNEAQYLLAAHWVMDDRIEEALELLLELMRRDRSFREDGARKAMLAVFEVLGGSGDLVNRYRNRMFNLLH